MRDKVSEDRNYISNYDEQRMFSEEKEGNNVSYDISRESGRRPTCGKDNSKSTKFERHE